MQPAEVDRILTQSPVQVIEDLSNIPEGQWFERKSGQITARELAIPLVAFANAEGGHVTVGLRDGRPTGIAPQRVNDLRQASLDFTNPPVRSHVTEFHTNAGEVVLLFRVSPGDRVHETTKGDCYLRVGDESRKLGFAQRQELEYDRGGAPFDGTAVDASFADLDDKQVIAYQRAIGSSTPESMLIARDLLTRDEELTVAGWLLFAGRPQRIFPSAHVRLLRYTSDERGTGSGMTLAADGDLRCEGSIPEQITRATSIIEEWVPQVRALASSGRFEPRPIIPRDVWLEGLVNAVIHRSYSMSGDHVRVEVFPHRIEITNPGRFPGLADPGRPLSISRFARNPRIVRVCSDLGIARELGEGIQRIFAEMRDLGLTDPIYTQTSGAVRLTLSAADALPEEVRRQLPAGARRVLDALRLAGQPLSTGQIAELVDIARPTAIRHLRALQEVGLIIWEGQSQRDPRASWRLR